jgi:hypothetical protein
MSRGGLAKGFLRRRCVVEPSLEAVGTSFAFKTRFPSVAIPCLASIAQLAAAGGTNTNHLS